MSIPLQCTRRIHMAIAATLLGLAAPMTLATWPPDVENQTPGFLGADLSLAALSLSASQTSHTQSHVQNRIQANTPDPRSDPGLEQSIPWPPPQFDQGALHNENFIIPLFSYGQEGQRHFSVNAGSAFSIERDSATDLGLWVGYHHFIANHIETIAELAILNHNQVGDNAIGFNPSLNVRWHYLNKDSWTLFVDAGIGTLLTTDNVPDGGTSLNFTPRAGVGLTYDLAELWDSCNPPRLILGARWHHISNARLNGNSRNPDRDGIMLYLGLNFELD